MKTNTKDDTNNSDIEAEANEQPKSEETVSNNDSPDESNDTISINKKEYDKLVADLEKQKKDYLYLYAEMDNLRKRTVKERTDLIKYGTQNVFTSLLDIVDNFQRALSAKVDKDNEQSFLDGVKLINELLLNLLKEFSVTEVASLGEAFDPTVHEAIGTEPSDTVPEGHICKVLVKPYKLHDRTIRVGRVIVVNNQNEKNSDLSTTSEDQ